MKSFFRDCVSFLKRLDDLAEIAVVSVARRLTLQAVLVFSLVAYSIYCYRVIARSSHEIKSPFCTTQTKNLLFDRPWFDHEPEGDRVEFWCYRFVEEKTPDSICWHGTSLSYAVERFSLQIASDEPCMTVTWPLRNVLIKSGYTISREKIGTFDLKLVLNQDIYGKDGPKVFYSWEDAENF